MSLPVVVKITQQDQSRALDHAGAMLPRQLARLAAMPRHGNRRPTGAVVRVLFAGTDDREGFHCVFFPADDMFQKMADAFGGEFGETLEGKTVTIKGEVSLFKDRPQMKINSPKQIRVK